MRVNVSTSKSAGARPHKIKRRKSTGGREIRLARYFRHTHLHHGAIVEVRILQRGFTGKVVRYRVRRTEVRAVAVFCLAPGARKPVSCAAVTNRRPT